MIEAVNSVVASVSTLRASAEVISAARAPVDVAPVFNVGEARAVSVPQAPYISPYVVFDRNYNRAVLQIRDSETGDVLQQFPTQSRLSQITQAQQLTEARKAAKESTVSSDGFSVQVQQTSVQSKPQARTDYVSVQEVTSTPPANNVPSQAIAAFTAGAQAAQIAQASSVSVYA